MSMLHDIKESKVWQETYQIGFQRGLKKALEEGRESIDRALVKRLRAKGKTLEIAAMFDFTLAEVRRFARSK